MYWISLNRNGFYTLQLDPPLSTSGAVLDSTLLLAAEAKFVDLSLAHLALLFNLPRVFKI